MTKATRKRIKDLETELRAAQHTIQIQVQELERARFTREGAETRASDAAERDKRIEWAIKQHLGALRADLVNNGIYGW